MEGARPGEGCSPSPPCLHPACCRGSGPAGTGRCSPPSSEEETGIQDAAGTVFTLRIQEARCPGAAPGVSTRPGTSRRRRWGEGRAAGEGGSSTEPRPHVPIAFSLGSSSTSSGCFRFPPGSRGSGFSGRGGQVLRSRARSWARACPRGPAGPHPVTVWGSGPCAVRFPGLSDSAVAHGASGLRNSEQNGPPQCSTRQPVLGVHPKALKPTSSRNPLAGA